MTSVVLAVVLLGGLVGCDPADRVSDEDIKSIDYERLVNVRNDPDAGLVVVDVRRERDFAAGHIPGAIHIFLRDINRPDRRLQTAKLIVIYDSGLGSDDLARAATKVLLKSGYRSVLEFRGGMQEWEAEGGQIEVSPSTDD